MNCDIVCQLNILFPILFDLRSLKGHRKRSEQHENSIVKASIRSGKSGFTSLSIRKVLNTQHDIILHRILSLGVLNLIVNVVHLIYCPSLVI